MARVAPPLKIARFRHRNDVQLQALAARQPEVLSSGLADHLDQHLRAAWAKAEASFNGLKVQPLNHFNG